MRYYGSKYKGDGATYNTSNLCSYCTAYEALIAVNREYDLDSDKRDARLFAVLRRNDSANRETESIAYFEFADSKSCVEFVNEQRTIIWSIAQEQKWNGNAGLMG